MVRFGSVYGQLLVGGRVSLGSVFLVSFWSVFGHVLVGGRVSFLFVLRQFFWSVFDHKPKTRNQTQLTEKIDLEEEKFEFLIRVWSVLS